MMCVWNFDVNELLFFVSCIVEINNPSWYKMHFLQRHKWSKSFTIPHFCIGCFLSFQCVSRECISYVTINSWIDLSLIILRTTKHIEKYANDLYVVCALWWPSTNLSLPISILPGTLLVLEYYIMMSMSCYFLFLVLWKSTIQVDTKCIFCRGTNDRRASLSHIFALDVFCHCSVFRENVFHMWR